MAAGSARGLFRATGKSAKDVPLMLLDGSFEKGEAVREADDFYPTPPEPTQALLAAELPVLRGFQTIWEPAAGDGAMAREIEALGFTVVKSDLVDRGCGATIRNFYEYQKSTAPSNVIITNPPFAECNRDPGWVRHAMEEIGADYMALLLPINWLGAAGRAALWAQFPPARVYLMRWRIDFTGQGAPPMLNAWFIWDGSHTGEPLLRMMDKADARQVEMFGDAA